MKHLTAIFFFLASSLMPALATPQDADIFITQPRSGENPPDAPSLHDTLDLWLALQFGLYDVVSAFDEKARNMQESLYRFENRQIQQHLRKILAPDTQPPKPTPGEIRDFDAVAREPSMCTQLAQSLETYITKNAPKLDAAIQELTTLTQQATDRQKSEIAAHISRQTASRKSIRRAQEILYLCLYKQKDELGLPRKFPVEKQMRAWFRIQLPLLDLWLGDIDS